MGRQAGKKTPFPVLAEAQGAMKITNRKMMQLLGITSTLYYKWRQDGEFPERYTATIKDLLAKFRAGELRGLHEPVGKELTGKRKRGAPRKVITVPEVLPSEPIIIIGRLKDYRELASFERVVDGFFEEGVTIVET